MVNLDLNAQRSKVANRNKILELNTMTTPSATILVDGTPSAVPTSQATSVYGEEESLESNATVRHRLEQLTLPTLRPEQDWPSAASFNSSLDRLNGDDSNEAHAHPVHSIQGNQRNSEGDALTPQVDSVNGTPNHGSLQNASSSSQVLINNEPTIAAEPLHGQQAQRNNHILQPDYFPTIASPSPPSPSFNHTRPSPPQTSTSSPDSQPSGQPSSPRISPILPNQRIHRRRHRRRLLHWFQRRLENPLPWHLSLRRRADNVRRRILDVDRLLP
ncbi:MAG: hypothetical protein Q9209_005448 [Squamulea sp. 1 TL-2023]